MVDLGLHEPGQQRAGCIHHDTEWHVRVSNTDGAVGEESAGFQLLEDAGVLEHPDVMHLPQPPDVDISQLPMVFDEACRTMEKYPLWLIIDKCPGVRGLDGDVGAEVDDSGQQDSVDKMDNEKCPSVLLNHLLLGF